MATDPNAERARTRSVLRKQGPAVSADDVREDVLSDERPDDTTIVAAQVEPTFIHRERAIAELAYLLAEKRGMAPGCELDDWLAAEKEIDTILGCAE